MWSETWSELSVVKVDVYSMAVGTVTRGCGSIDRKCLFHCAVGDGCGGAVCIVCGMFVRHSANVRYMSMSVRYRQCACVSAVVMVVCVFR